ncbi:anti-sigma factor domain-containing protein [Paenibacillus sp. CF384]|uniref:anti-sigma factor n=1 Tax=Paenibacillus sp. CF384 TaxID=1884382 RepID=UPI0008993B09|nr:anti-sigma factor [Paenibacillus sp. CF384]SDX99695.1 Putative zinc-finger [Paenibacillus sp. CF384]
MNKQTSGCENLEMYAVGGLDEAEKNEFELHLKGCAACAAELVELVALVDLLPMASEPVAVPEGMRARVLDHVLGESSVQQADKIEIAAEQVSSPKRDMAKRNRIRPWFYAGMSAAVLILAVYCYNLKQHISDLQTELAQENRPAEAVQVNNVVALSSTAKEIVAKGLATIVIDAKGTHLLVQAEKLPELQHNEAYQVWLIKGKETPVNAGTFMTHNGTGGLYYTFNPDSYDTIAITLEPDAHGDTPRGKPVLVAAL